MTPDDLARLQQVAQHTSEQMMIAARQLSVTRADWQQMVELPVLMAQQQRLIDLLRDGSAAIDALLAAVEEQGRLKAKYHDLIFQVETVYPGESRHDTAKRYIRERETRDDGPAKAVARAD